MQILNRRRLLGFAGTAPLAAATTVGPAAANPNPAIARARDRIRRLYFPDLPLVTQAGRKVWFYEDLVKDKIVILNFFYARCEGICPRVTHNLVRVQKQLGDRMGRDVFINSISLKPEQDNVEALAAYAKMHGIQPGWTLLTGKPEDCERLRQTLGFTNLEPELDKDKSQHIGNIRYGSEPLMQWTAIPGMTKPEAIAYAIDRDFPAKKA